MAKTDLNMTADEVKAYIEKDIEGALLIAEAHFGFKPNYAAKDEAGNVVTKEAANKAVFDAMLKKMEEQGQTTKDATAKTRKKAVKKEKSAGAETEKKPGMRRGQVDYSTMETPYRSGCSQGIIFDLLKANNIKAAEVKEKSLAALTAAGKITKNIGVLITATVGDASRRGWKFEEKEGIIIVTRLTPEPAKV